MKTIEEYMRALSDHNVLTALTDLIAGHFIANQQLPLVEPGYRVDVSQTIKYKSEIKEYMEYLPVLDEFEQQHEEALKMLKEKYQREKTYVKN